MVFRAKRYVFDVARQRAVTHSAQPFCLVVSLISPHDPYLARSEHWDRYRHEDIDMPKLRFGDVPLDPHSARIIKSIGMQDPPQSDDEVRNARHAYYGSISYIDERFADLMQALKESGMAEDTVTIVTGDHGDMLGERGLWFKMNWFEHSARVPLLVRAPTRFRPRRVAAAVSLVDIMPTLLDLAAEGEMLHEEAKGDGHSLVGHLSGAGGTDEVIGEYTAEGARAPLMMIRRGTLKYVCSPGDPDQLYDINADPLERDNLAAEKAYAARVGTLRQECARRWRMELISESVIASQRRRRYLDGILRTQNVSWDYEPPLDAKNQYIRNTVPIFELEMRSRFPPRK